MPKLVLLVGPPGSGKSTLAQEYIQQGYIRISQDDQGKEGHLNAFYTAIKHCDNIIIDRMNFDKKQRERYIQNEALKGHLYKTKIVVLHENKDTCIKRGLKRLDSGDHPTILNEQDLRRAIGFFFSHYERPTLDEADEVEYRYPQLTLQSKAIICDIDGTAANIDHRLHFVREGKKDWKNFMLPQNVEQDKPNEWCRQLVNNMRQRNLIIMCSGRPDTLRDTTKVWLHQNLVWFDELFMRPRDDHRQDAIVKEIILDFEILTRYHVFFAIDDRKQVVDMWRSRGITTLACAEGDF